MTEERLKLYEKAEKKIDAYIDTLSQDKGGLADKLKQEDVKDFLISLWVDCATEATKELQEQNEYLNNLVKEKEQRGLEIQEDLLKEKAELEAQIEELKELLTNVIKIINRMTPSRYLLESREELNALERAEMYLLGVKV